MKIAADAEVTCTLTGDNVKVAAELAIAYLETFQMGNRAPTVAELEACSRVQKMVHNLNISIERYLEVDAFLRANGASM